jgi:hypothetical protein
MSETTILDESLKRAFERGQYVKFLSLSRRKLKRLRKSGDKASKARRVSFFAMLKRLPELRQQQRLNKQGRGV